jgi:hypothetical protein
VYYPARYHPLNLVRLDERGQPTEWPETYDYVPPGFYRIWPFDFGNGDVHGLYWPLGREREEPLVCETYHDGAWLEPHASNLEGCIRLKWAQGFPGETSRRSGEAKHLADQLGLQLWPPSSRQEHQAPPLTELLQADPRSPARLVRSARECLGRNALEQAERHLRLALAVLPEYTEARGLLAGLLRRLRRQDEAIEEMLHVLGCPPCFGGNAEQCLGWLQRAGDDPRFAHDPLGRRRRELTLEVGTANDYRIYEEAITAYLGQGRFFEAVTLRLTSGQRMLRETHPFQERQGFTWSGHLRQLKAELALAGWQERAEAIFG